MIDTLKIFDELKENLNADAARKIADTIGFVYKELQNSVTKAEFNELKEVVSQLADAQVRTEEQLNQLAIKIDRLTEKVEALAEAQARTEERLDRLTEKVEALAEAQARTEERLNRLTERVEALAEAQARTEERLDRLTERVEALAEAQLRTQKQLNQLTAKVDNLVDEHKKTRKELGGLTATIGYTLENTAYDFLPGLLQQNYDLTVKERLIRRYVTDNQGSKIELNIVGKAAKNGQEILIVGEVKAQLSKNDIDRFIRKKLRRLEGLYGEIFPVLVTHMISSDDVEDYARQKGMAVFYSYDLKPD